MICAGCRNDTASSRINLSVAQEGERAVAELDICDQCRGIANSLTFAVLAKRDSTWKYQPLPDKAQPPRPTGTADVNQPKATFSQKAVAQMQGFTGDVCLCGSYRIVRTGTCATCQDCGGTSGGCS